jgi:NNP family nitrate/nitrite transporter-like MFS transporter
MKLADFRRAGHWPSLLSAFMYFDVSFMIWVLLGPLAPNIAAELWPRPAGVGLDEHLRQTAAWRGMLVSIPLLGGSILRLVLGFMTDRIGARRTGLIGMGLTALPLLLGWLWADSLAALVLVGLLLGVAGASFAAALPLASRWYPPRYQGLALGIAGAGNSGTALATLFAPLLATSLGWRAVFGLALIPLVVTFMAFLLLAKDAPSQPPPQPLRAYGRVLGRVDAWWFCFFYGITFGGFVGLASFLTTLFRDQYFAVDPTAVVRVSYLVTACVVAGSFLRPAGGYLADRFGGGRVLIRLYAGVSLVLLGVATLPTALAAAVLLAAGMGMLGMGNGAVFQLVPRRFPKEIGVVTGLVGAAGGVGGFFLPNVLGLFKGWTGSYGVGFAVLAAGSLCGAAALWALGWVREPVAEPAMETVAAT